MKPFRPRKSLGQSFLRHLPTADALVEALAVGQDDTVLEIGPGKGVLTSRLLARAGRVIAVEVDPRLTAILRASLNAGSRFDLVEGDFLCYDLGVLKDVKVIGNLPYNVSSQILYRLLDNTEVWTTAVLTTQREFAHRVLGQPGSKAYAPLSVFLERVSVRQKLFNITPERFRPRPDVVSTAFRLVRRSRPLFELDDEDLFREIVKSGFAQRRKTIANSVAVGFRIPKSAAVQLLQMSGIDADGRAECVDPEGFLRLYDAFRSRAEGRCPDSRSSE